MKIHLKFIHMEGWSLQWLQNSQEWLIVATYTYLQMIAKYKISSNVTKPSIGNFKNVYEKIKQLKI
jgi:hypothetical protein